MNSVQTYQKRLRDEVATVEKEVQSHSQQIEALNKRLEGLKRAIALFESEQPAIAELLRTSMPDGDGFTRGMAMVSTAIAQETASSRRQGPLQKKPGRPGHNGRGKAKAAQAQFTTHKASQNGGLKRVDMIAAVLRRRTGLSVRDLIAALDKEFGWKTTESAVTAHLYTNRKRFVHTKGDRSSNRLVTWSVK
jgi:hypothetical protein